MAKTPDVEPKKPKNKAKEAAAWVLMAMLVLGLGGFGVTSFGGGVTSIGKVGDTPISTNDYANAFRQQINEFSQKIGKQLSPQEAVAFGLDRQVLQGIITRTAMDNEAHRIGLSVGDASVAARLTGMDAFKGAAGTFDREAYRFALQRNRTTEAEFEAGLRHDLARSLLQGAVGGGFVAPTSLTETLYAWIGERRGFSTLLLTEADLTTPVPAPSDAELKAFYDTNIATFTSPEAKRITYAALLPEAIAKDQPVDEAALKKMYDDRIEDYVTPERRLVERLVYPDQAAADAAKAKLDGGAKFEDLVADRGLTLAAIDLGDVSKADVGAAADALFAKTEPGIVGPVMTDLGPAIFRVNGILPAEETTFDQARADLVTEMQTDAARKVISDQVETVDDLLAGGASLEDLQKDTGMVLGTLDHVPGQQGTSPIEGYAAFQTAADAVAAEDFPAAIVLDDGGLVALRMDKIVPAAPIPFDKARDAVTTAWHAAAVAKALSARAVEIKAAVEGGASIGSFGIVAATPEIARSGTIEGAPASLLPGVFEMKQADVRVIEDKDYVAVIQLDKITPAANEGDDAKALRASLAAQIQQAIAQDAFDAFTSALTSEAGIELDQAAINAVQSRLQ